MTGWLKIEDWQQDELPWPGDRIDAEYTLSTMFPVTVLAAWLKGMEAQFEASLLFQYTGYTWAPDSDTIVFHFTVRDYVQDIESGNLKVRKDGKFQEEQVDPQQANWLSLAGTIAGASIGVAGFSWLIAREIRIAIVAGTIHDIYLDPTKTPEEKQAAYDALMKLGGGASGTWTEAVGGTLSSATMLIVALIGLLLVWPMIRAGGAK
jgi:hypothetical protein